MAGMLPGVEAARRRRVHLSGGCNDLPSMAAPKLTRRASFCLYSSSHDAHQCHHSSSSIIQTRSIVNQSHMDDKLAGVAREAKQRLDEKLRTLHTKTQTSRRECGKGKLSCAAGHSALTRELHTEVYGSKKGGLRRFSWAKISKKGSDQDECAVCLESFKMGEILMHLPCSHRFHSGCLEPWLENSAHCPCCRTGISSS